MYTLPIEDLENIFDRVQGFWPKNKVFLITGGTGFFGRWLVESAAYFEEKLGKGNRFLIYSRQDKADLVKKIPVLGRGCFQLIQHDLIAKFKIDSSVDYVLHAASDVSKLKTNNVTDFTLVLTGTRNVISAVEDKKITKFLYVSSGGIYPTANKISEDQLKLEPTDNITSYAEAKRQCEIAVSNLSQACISRCFSFVGPFVDPKMAVMDMLAKKVNYQSITLNSPQVVRSFMYPTDLIVSLFQLLLLQTTQREYNVGSDQSISLLELAQKISQFVPASQVEVKSTPNTKALAGQVYYPSIERIQKEFPSHVTIDLDAALLKTFNFLLKQGQMI